MFERWFRKSPPLAGAPPVRRQKTYSAASGYVYQYYYQGHRPARGGVEYAFDVSADRKTSFAVFVLVTDEALNTWERAHRRDLVANERYAIAKMALFQAFDDRPDPAGMRAPIRVRPADADEILTKLGLE